MKGNKASITIGIVTYGLNTLLTNLLKHLSLQTQDHKVIVIDASNSRSKKEICKKHSNLYYIASNHNNLGKNRNLIVQHCKTPLLTFIDDDCIPQSTEWLEQIKLQLIEASKKDQQVVGYGGGQVYYSSSGSSKLTINYLSLISFLFDSPQFNRKLPKEADHLPTNNCIFFSDVLKTTTFPSTPFNTGEDLTLGRRLINQKYKLIKADKPRVYHYTKTDRWFKKMFLYGRAQVFSIKTCPQTTIPIRFFISTFFLPIFFIFAITLKYFAFFALLLAVSSHILKKSNVFWTNLLFFPFIFFTSSLYYSLGIWIELLLTTIKYSTSPKRFH